jgi:REP element-mobilizing transposase RayT
MPNTFSKIYIQIVFAVKYRKSMIDKSWREELHKYICGVANGNNQKVYAIGGVEDHIHILIRLRPNICIADLVRDIKACSTKWINERGFVKGNKFSWQVGYGVFSYSESHLENVIRYINNQEQHHQKQNLRDEFIELLKEYQLEYDEKYVLDELK